jgi:alanine racemase
VTPAAPSAVRSFLRPTWVEVDLDAFRRNLSSLAGRLRPGVKLIVVLKADGYGHGARPLAKAAAEMPGLPLWGFGVSSVEEGAVLREAGVRQPVLILGSLFPFESFAAALENGLTPTVASLAAAKALEKASESLGRRTGVHVKVDTGMGRIGLSPRAAGEAIGAVVSSPHLKLEGVYTHLAEADSADRTREQLGLFDKALQGVTPGSVLRHVANSAATLLYMEAQYDAVRPGLTLYGLAPLSARPLPVPLSPVLAWKTRIVFLKTVEPGAAVSYGATFRVERKSRLATLPVGYADGYRRAFSNKASVLVRGRRCPVAGRVTMDQTVVDVTDVPGADVGDEVALIGAQGTQRVGAEELAAWADTIPYEVVCGITSRVPRVVLK